MSGIYVHIPFCASRCIYCGFYSTVGKESLQTSYINAIKSELSRRKDYITENSDGKFTIYYGGGTPSVLAPDLLTELTKSIKETLSIEANAIEEFTIECNPDDITEDFARHIANMGVDRVSMGVQTFADNRLKFIKRRHQAAQIPQAVNALRKAGITNISIDLMFGFPNETLAEWKEDLHKALALTPRHISAYSLMYEEGTPLYRMLKEGKVRETDEDSSREMYETLIDTLTSKGYEHYEISNFALPGYRSHHNSNYWNDTPYLGLGAAAHSYNGKTRQWNISNIEHYIRNHTIGGSEIITPIIHYNDMITTALRTKEGITVDKVAEPYKSYLLQNAKNGIGRGNLILENGTLHLTRQGLFISDDVMSELIML